MSPLPAMLSEHIRTRRTPRWRVDPRDRRYGLPPQTRRFAGRAAYQAVTPLDWVAGRTKIARRTGWQAAGLRCISGLHLLGTRRWTPAGRHLDDVVLQGAAGERVIGDLTLFTMGGIMFSRIARCPGLGRLPASGGFQTCIRTRSAASIRLTGLDTIN